ncbi:hypothetical protein XU18_1426 [Perkinsela sp. CCAP 1560/4]|nr:hypothetical protein XU18_1426 [Perkinsela sp. CCAP 1560/4]|eukprot:KNH07994.1 hypothetical protein XU18_1426 [Perkinsela sp. CCAP 1560/4]
MTNQEHFFVFLVAILLHVYGHRYGLTHTGERAVTEIPTSRRSFYKVQVTMAVHLTIFHGDCFTPKFAGSNELLGGRFPVAIRPQTFRSAHTLHSSSTICLEGLTLCQSISRRGSQWPFSSTVPANMGQREKLGVS